jgi:hypothetical protein
MNRASSRVRRWAAIALLGVMCLGSATHFLHHLLDRDCDPDGRHGLVPCTACSVLHGGALAPQPEISAPRSPGLVTRTAFVEAAEPESRHSIEGTPRAPPAA